MSLHDIALAVWPVTLLLQVAWFARVWRAGLLARYPLLASYLAAYTALGVIAYLSGFFEGKISGHSPYFWVFMVGRPIAWCLTLGVVYECFNHMVEGYVGVRRLGALFFQGAMGSILAVLLMLYLAWPYGNAEEYWKRTFLVHEQSVHLGAAVGILALFLLRRTFQLQTTQNSRVVIGAFGLYFAGISALVVFRSYVGPQLQYFLDASGLVLYAAALAFGSYLFHKTGEERQADPRHTLTGKEPVFDLATARLEHVNTQLIKALAR